MTKRKISVKKIALFLIVLSIIFVLIFIKIGLSSVSKDNTSILIEVKEGDNYYTLADTLKENDLINSKLIYEIYIKIASPSSLIVGSYNLNKTMDLKEIVDTISNSDNIVDTSIKMTFREGLNIPQIGAIVEKNTSFTAEDFINTVNDSAYQNELIKKYWFLTKDIKNKNIYYSLEGYLYPNTYSFKKDEISIKSIIESMLNDTENKLEPFKDSIKNNPYSVHEILTLASMIELEAQTENDRKLVSSVFYNRLNASMTLGSDVTSYYGAKKAMTEPITYNDLNACNGYNTRCKAMKGLPVGPIDNPDISSIDAAINPKPSKYYYFVADSKGKVYFSKNANEQSLTIAKLKEEGLWSA